MIECNTNGYNIFYLDWHKIKITYHIVGKSNLHMRFLIYRVRQNEWSTKPYDTYPNRTSLVFQFFGLIVADNTVGSEVHHSGRLLPSALSQHHDQAMLDFVYS
ncbi:TPA: hypothetical protein U1215_001306, partial [Streptococcus suis]|nr:hypothetical protein [Streptococcus suis]